MIYYKRTTSLIKINHAPVSAHIQSAPLAQEMKTVKNNTDRILGTLCSLLVVASAGVTFMNWSVSWVMFGLSAIWTIGLSIWTIHGWWKWKLDIGWEGQLLLFNQRMNFSLKKDAVLCHHPSESTP